MRMENYIWKAIKIGVSNVKVETVNKPNNWKTGEDYRMSMIPFYRNIIK